MTHQDEIDALLTEAAPLRLLPDDEAEAKGLPALVDKINRLRAVQARDAHLRDSAIYVEQKAADKAIGAALGAALAESILSEDDPCDPLPGAPITRKKPGPKPRATIEGADAP
jgi:hypothetical protein